MFRFLLGGFDDLEVVSYDSLQSQASFVYDRETGKNPFGIQCEDLLLFASARAHGCPGTLSESTYEETTLSSRVRSPSASATGV
jgi:hypothetical protein